MRPAPQTEALFDLSGAVPADPEPPATLPFDPPQQTKLEDAIRRFRETYSAVRAGNGTETDLLAARQDVTIAAHRELDSDEHHVDWLGATLPHLIGAACSCGERLAGFILVDFAAAKVVAHAKNGARL